MSCASNDLRIDTLLDQTLRKSAEHIWCQPMFEHGDTKAFFSPIIRSPVWNRITHTQRQEARQCDLIRPHTTHASWAGQTEDGHHITLQSTCDTRKVRTRAVFQEPNGPPTMTVTWIHQEYPTKLLDDCLHYRGDTGDMCDDNPEAWESAAEEIVEAVYSIGYMDSDKGLIEPSSGIPLSGSTYWEGENLVIELSLPTPDIAWREIRSWKYDKTLNRLSVDGA